MTHQPILLLKKRCLTVSVAVTTVLTVNTPVLADDLASPFMMPQCDVVFGVDDRNLNNSQIIFMNGDGTNAQPLGVEKIGLDLEALDIDTDRVLYVASGDETSTPGHLYKVDKITADLTSMGALCVREADGISFNPIDNTLWGWGQDQGIFHVSRGMDGELDLSTCQIILPGTEEIEDLTWNNDGTTLYGIGNVTDGDHDAGGDSAKSRVISAFTPATSSISTVCREEIAPIASEIEGIEMGPDDILMLTYHNASSMSVYATIDPITCELDTGETNPTSFKDIEALACCVNQDTSNMSWTYQQDYVGDATGSRQIEIYGMAIKIEDNTLFVAINANMEGQAPVPYKDELVSYSDMVFDFQGIKYAVKFTPETDSNATEQGLYADITLKDVTKKNYGHVSFKRYSKRIKGEGDLGALALQNDYFSWDAKRSVPMSIESGTKVADITLLNEATLIAEGLDLPNNLENAQGAHTFGFSFEMMPDMQGGFLAYFFTECINDGTAIIVSPDPTSCGVSPN